MDKFIIAAAQSGSIRGDLNTNIKTHLTFINTAVEHKANLIIFPELSLTGYEPDIASENIIELNDDRLKPFYDLSSNHKTTIIVGAPVMSEHDKPNIGAIIIKPDKSEIYRKQHLHTGEEMFFSPGSESKLITVNSMKIGPAICADIMHPSHPEKAAQRGAQIYTAGVLITKNGYSKDADQMQNYAMKHKMLVVMANYCSPTGGFDSAGKSAIWDETGQQIAIAGESEKALLLAKKDKHNWSGERINI